MDQAIATATPPKTEYIFPFMRAPCVEIGRHRSTDSLRPRDAVPATLVGQPSNLIVWEIDRNAHWTEC